MIKPSRNDVFEYLDILFKFATIEEKYALIESRKMYRLISRYIYDLEIKGCDTDEH